MLCQPSRFNHRFTRRLGNRLESRKLLQPFVSNLTQADDCLEKIDDFTLVKTPLNNAEMSAEQFRMPAPRRLW